MSNKNFRFLRAALAVALLLCAALALVPETRVGDLLHTSASARQRGIACMGTPFVEDLYDKMGDKTTVKFNPILVKEFPSREICVFADFSYPGHDFSKPSKITLGFVHAALSETLNSGFSSKHDLTLTIGGEQVALGTTSYKNKEETGLRGKVQHETMSLEVQSAVFLRLANASQATVKLGETEFTLDDKQLKALKKIADRAQLN
ncbi:MAG TPA: hypothetical protein VEX60_00505 [Pyrinomonadaceae bacterium]|nr:hypothetical protein [Pyrinomonadaceae bacterium]